MAEKNTGEFKMNGNDPQANYALEHKDEELEFLPEKLKTSLEYEGPATALDHKVSFLNSMKDQLGDITSASDATPCREAVSRGFSAGPATSYLPTNG